MADVTRRSLKKGTTLASKPSKYRNVKTVVGTETFDSGREAAYWQGLLVRERGGEIRSLRRQVKYALLAPDRQHGNEVVVAYYMADFVFEERCWYLPGNCIGWRGVVADAKGKRTQMYLLKKKWLELQDGIVIREV